jgi:hypothetical protein
MGQIDTAGAAGRIGGAILGGVVSGNVKGAVGEGIGGITEVVGASGASDKTKQWTNTIGNLAQTGLSLSGSGAKGATKGAGNAAASSGSSGFGDVMSNFSGTKFGQNANKAMPLINQASGMIGDNKGSLREQGQAQQDILNSPDYIAAERERNEAYTNQGLMYGQGGNMLNNSLNLRNTMRYKKFANGGTFDQFGINLIPKSAGLHHESAYGGVPIGPDALAEGGEAKLQMADGGQYIVSDQVDGANTQTIDGQTMAERLKKKLKPFMMGGLASNPKDREAVRRPYDSYSKPAIDQAKNASVQETEAVRMQRGGALQYAAHGGKLNKDIEKIVMEEYSAAYGGMLPNKYKGKVNMPNSYSKGGNVQEFAKQILASKGGYVHNQMTQPMYAVGGPVYGDPASPHTYAMGGPDKDKPWTAPIPIGNNIEMGSNNVVSAGYGNKDTTFSEHGMRNIHTYDNGLPNDTSYIYQSNRMGINPSTEDYFYNTGQNTQDGKPVSNYNSGSTAPLDNKVYLDRIKKLAGYARGGQIDYTNDMYSSYAGGGPMPSNLPQAFDGPSAQNSNGMYAYPDGGAYMAGNTGAAIPIQQPTSNYQPSRVYDPGGKGRPGKWLDLNNPTQQKDALLQNKANQNGLNIYGALPTINAEGGMLPPDQQMMQAPQEQMQEQGGQEQIMQMVQQAAQMLEQGAQPEQVMQQLVESGVPQDMAMQAVQMAMQEMQGQMQQQSQEQPMQGQEQMMPQEGMMAHGGMYPDGGKRVYTNPKDFQKADTAYKDSLDTYNNVNAINTRINTQIAKPAGQRPFSSQAQFKPWMQGIVNAAVSRGEINPSLLQNAPTTQIQHTSGPLTNYTPITATKPKVQPVYQKPTPQRQNPPVQQPPVQQPLPVVEQRPVPRPATPQTPQKDTYIERPYMKGHSTKYYNLNSTDPIERKKAFEANKANNAMIEAKKYENNKKSNNTSALDIMPAFGVVPANKAEGGIVSPQNGMSSQVAQQLKQGVEPQQVLQQLVQQGMSQEQAMAMVQAVMSQVTNEMQQQPQQQMAPPQQMMAARGGYFNGRKQYADSGWAPNQQEESTGNTFSPLSDESTMSKIAGLGQAVVPALTSAFAFNKLSKRKIKPTAIEAALQNRDAEITALKDEWRNQTASGLRQLRNMGQTAGSVAGNTRELILSSLKEGQKPIMQIYSELSAANQQAEQQARLANKQATDDFAKENESMYQNAMQTGFEAAGQGVKNASAYYSDLEDRNLQRWQAMNTSGEDWHWTPKGKAFRNKEGLYMINGVEVNPSTGNPV